MHVIVSGCNYGSKCSRGYIVVAAGRCLGGDGGSDAAAGPAPARCCAGGAAAAAGAPRARPERPHAANR